jgi:putative SOS response-associated peptidase YedK
LGIVARGSSSYCNTMCGLYSFKASAEEVRRLFEYVETPDLAPRPYVAPLSPIVIVRQENGARHFEHVRWGFIPSWLKEPKPGKPIINARSETLLEKPSFKNAIRRRRCLIPADGYYEWVGDVPGKKIPHYIHRPDHGLFAFAGIWEHWMGADGSEIETAAIITSEPNAVIAKIYDRMPIVVQPENHATWLDVRSEDTSGIMLLLKSPADDYFVHEPIRIERKAPPPKPKAQLDLF